jgi:uncharacterized membrane protein YbhN (UPF0104 family)
MKTGNPDQEGRSPGANEPSYSATGHRQASALLGAGVSALSLGAVVWWASRQERPDFPNSAAAFGLVVGALGAYVLATIARGWRWHKILRRAGVPHRTADAYALVPVGYMGNTVLPLRGGELLRMTLLASRSSARRRDVLGSILAERLLDATALVVLFAGMSWAGTAGAPAGQWPAAVAVALAALAGLGMALYLRLRLRGLLEPFARVVRPFSRPTRLMLGPSGAGLLLVTLIVWLLEGCVFYLVARSLDVHLDLPGALFVIVLASFFALVPSAPGYVGTFDAAVLFGLAALNVSGGGAVSIALLLRFVLFVPITLVGLALLVVRYGGLSRLVGRTKPSPASRVETTAERLD